MDDCMKLKMADENLKVRRSLCPQQRCPNKPILCPPKNPMRSSIYHPDFRTENQFCCTQDCGYIPTQAAMDVINYKPPNSILYNQPKRDGGRIKILSDGSCYPHRDINQLHCNLRAKSSCADQNARQLYICKDCGCGFQEKNDCCEEECAPKPAAASCTQSAVYFQVDSCREENQHQNQDCETETNKESCIENDNAVRDYCNPPRRDDANCNRPRPSARGSNGCVQEQEDGDSGPSCCTQPNVIASLPDPANPEESNPTACHYVFRLGDEAKKQPTAHCVIDMNNDTIRNGNCAGAGLPFMQSPQSWSNGFGNGNGMAIDPCNPWPKEQRMRSMKICCPPFQQYQSLHGPCCPCGQCQRLRCESARRPNYYAHLQARSQCRQKDQTCPIPPEPVCYPIKCEVGCGIQRPSTAPNYNNGNGVCIEMNPGYSCKSNCLCHVMMPKEWEPKETCGARPAAACAPVRQVKLPRCNAAAPRSDPCARPPVLVRSLAKCGSGKKITGSGSSRCKPGNPNWSGFKC